MLCYVNITPVTAHHLTNVMEEGLPIKHLELPSSNVCWVTIPVYCNYQQHSCSRLRLKRDGTRTETGFGVSAKRTCPFKSAERSVQSNTSSRGCGS
jgi:hypothetical protein